jgi:protein SCO1/2
LLPVLLPRLLASQQLQVPDNLKEVGFDQRLGESLPMTAEFKDSTGRSRPLADFFGEKPVVLALVYYECPMLCTMVLNGVLASLRTLDFTVGEEFDVVVVSFDPREEPDLAAAKKAAYLESYGRAVDPSSWSFLTGSPESIKELTEATGFRYTWDEETQQFAHASGIIVASPQGVVSKYFYGIDFPPNDLHLGLVEASEGRIGSVIDSIQLYCFRYDPVTGQYSLTALTLIRAGGVVMVLLLASYLIYAFRQDRLGRPTPSVQKSSQ